MHQVVEASIEGRRLRISEKFKRMLSLNIVAFQ